MITFTLTAYFAWPHCQMPTAYQSCSSQCGPQHVNCCLSVSSAQAELDAHDTSIQCLEGCSEREEVATCASGNKVKVWCFKRPTQPRLVVMLDHTDPEAKEEGDEHPAGGARDVLGGPSNMQWLTRSDVDGLPAEGRQEMPGIVQEAILNARADIPEVIQVGSIRRERQTEAAAAEAVRAQHVHTQLPA